MRYLEQSQELDKRSESYYSNSDDEDKGKRRRRRKEDIVRDFICKEKDCGKAYGYKTT